MDPIEHLHAARLAARIVSLWDSRRDQLTRAEVIAALRSEARAEARAGRTLIAHHLRRQTNQLARDYR